MVHKHIRYIRIKLGRTVGALSRKLRVRLASHHLSGPRKIKLQDDEVALVCMLKNGSYYLDGLLEHHRAIGITNFLFIDNGSDDDTVARLATLSDVTVISNKLPVAKYEVFIRSQIARRVINGGWFLFVDSDELIEMINGENRKINEYARYCNNNNYGVVVGQSLDLFSPYSLAETAKFNYKKSIDNFILYSICHIDNFEYHDRRVIFSWFLQSNTISNPDIKIKFGGVRRELFGENCALTHHRLIKNTPHIRHYTHPHCSSNARCADFTLLIRHYKFAGPYLSSERQKVINKTWRHGEDLLRLSKIEDMSFSFRSKMTHRFDGTKKLVDSGFLNCSEKFLLHFPFSPVPRSVSGQKEVSGASSTGLRPADKANSASVVKPGCR